MNIFEIALLISMASLGFRAITDKKMIFYFLRKPFDQLSERKNKIFADQKRYHELMIVDSSDLSAEERSEAAMIRIRLNYGTALPKTDPYKYDWLLFFMKPFLLCATCMASVHTLIWYPYLTDSFNYRNMILIMLVVAILNTLIWSLVELIREAIETLSESNCKS